jgi:hypothetical protein
MKRNLFLAGAVLFAAAAIQPAQAQILVAPTSVVTYNWGSIYMVNGQLIGLSLRLDRMSVVATVPVQLTLEDRHGNVVYQKTVSLATGKTAQWLVGVNLGLGGGAFGAFQDGQTMVSLPYDVRSFTAILRIPLADAAQPYVDAMTPTLNVIDPVQFYSVTSFSNNPHMTIAGLRM